MKRLAKEMTALVVSGISEIACELAWYQLRKHSSNQNFEPRAVLSSQLPISTINDIDIRDILGDPLMRSYIIQEIVLWARNSGLKTKTCSLETLSLYEETNSVKFELVNMSQNARADFLQQEEQHKAVAPVAADPVAPVAGGLLPPVDS